MSGYLPMNCQIFVSQNAWNISLLKARWPSSVYFESATLITVLKHVYINIAYWYGVWKLPTINTLDKSENFVDSV